MFVIDNIHHSKYELADYIEYKALACANRACSIESLRASLSAPEDEILINGTEEGDDKVLTKLQEALSYCSERENTLDGYPYSIRTNSLVVNNQINRKAYYYFFLLLTNRLNMCTENIQGDVNGTKLFERLCRCVAFEYFGPHCNCDVLGTSEKGSFKNKFFDILQKLYILGEYREPFGGTGHHKDGGIDLIAWIPFRDKKDSQLIALGQCKTGSTWEVYLNKTNIFSLFSTKEPYVDPIFIFFIAEDFNNYKWEERSKFGGILFDRRRILDFLPDNIAKFDKTLEIDITTWVNTAIGYIR